MATNTRRNTAKIAGVFGGGHWEGSDSGISLAKRSYSRICHGLSSEAGFFSIRPTVVELTPMNTATSSWVNPRAVRMPNMSISVFMTNKLHNAGLSVKAKCRLIMCIMQL